MTILRILVNWFLLLTLVGCVEVSDQHKKIEPRVSRAGDGLPYVVDRNRALGNSVVPRQARKAFMKLMGIK